MILFPVHTTRLAVVKTDYRWSKQTLPTSTTTYTLGGGQNGLSELLEATVETDYKLLAGGQNGLSDFHKPLTRLATQHLQVSYTPKT